MKKYEGKTVVVDIDGTLFNNEHQLGDENKKVLKYFKEHGGRIIIASGRDLSNLLEIGQQLELNDLSAIVGINGQKRYTYYNDTTIKGRNLNNEEVQELYEVSTALNIEMLFFCNSILYHNVISSEVKKMLDSYEG
ncbi:MAG: HAD family hydrolase, partial [Bacilli bacterium]